MRAFGVFIALLFSAAVHAAPLEIRFWHAMSGALGEQVDAIAREFNGAQKDYVVVPVYKGNYDETMAAAFIAHRAGEAPHIVQVYELGTANMMAAIKGTSGAVRSAWQVMAEAGEHLEGKAFVPAVASYFADPKGRLEAMPFNTSTPVLFYNKDAFRKAKLDPDKPPKTWYEMVPVLGALKDVGGLPCGYVTSWPSWIEIENMSAWHNQEFATKGNGIGGLDTKLVFNTHLIMRHVATLESWTKAEYFTYTGRRDQAEEYFKRGDCGLLTASSSTIAELRAAAKFDFGVSQLPYYDDIRGAPQNTLIGGGGLWVMGGHKRPEYRGVAKFFAWLERPEVQAEWSQKTGYVPVTVAAYELGKKQGYYEKNPGSEVAIRQLLQKNPTSDSKGIRLGFFPQIRAIIEEELEQVWSKKLTPKQALDEAAARGNVILRKFEALNKVGGGKAHPAVHHPAPPHKAVQAAHPKSSPAR